jgi:cyclomaltodextrinase
MPLGFWREYRQFVKAIKPDAYLIGEIWWKQFPDDLFDPAPVLQGDVFDAVMNYRWYRTARRFFGEAPQAILPSEFVSQLKAQKQNIDADHQHAMMNMSASHDSPRLLTSFNNKNKYKFNAKESQNPRYKGNKPSAGAVTRAKLLLAHQFTYIGAPQIWAGDEMGMWGSDDPHNRKPLMWSQYRFEDESSHPQSRRKSLDTVAFNASLHAYYQSLTAIRRDFPILSVGDIEFIDIDDKQRLLSYVRFDPNKPSQKAFVIFNLANRTKQITLPTSLLAYANWRIWRSDATDLKTSIPSETLSLAPQSSMIILMNDYQGN